MRKPETALSVYTGNAGTREQGNRPSSTWLSGVPLLTRGLGTREHNSLSLRVVRPAPFPQKKTREQKPPLEAPIPKGFPRTRRSHVDANRRA